MGISLDNYFHTLGNGGQVKSKTKTTLHADSSASEDFSILFCWAAAAENSLLAL